MHGERKDVMGRTVGRMVFFFQAEDGIRDWIMEMAYTYLDEPLKDVLRRWEQEVSIT